MTGVSLQGRWEGAFRDEGPDWNDERRGASIHAGRGVAACVSLLALFVSSVLAACSPGSASSPLPDTTPPPKVTEDAGAALTPDGSATSSPGDAGMRTDAVDTETVAPAEAGATDAEASALDAAFSLGSWTAVSYGVTATTSGTGPNIVIAYGGYTATLEDSQDWVAQLTRVRLAELSVGQLYAVQGPADPDYSSREIGNSELAAAVLPQAAAATRIVVIAHSSGDFVAGEFFTFADPTVIAKITYFNLDGGDAALTDPLVASMRGVYFCGAHDPVAGNSENYSSDQSLNAEFAGSHLFTVNATGSGCDVGAGWCLHDTLIINHPHDPTTFDLALDYTDFTNGRQVVSSYVDQAVSDGVL